MRKAHLVTISGSAVAIAVGLLVYISMNMQFDLIMPDNAELQNVTLSSDNFSRLKQNVGVFTVYGPHPTAHNTTTGYCPLAEFIHVHEDGYNNTRVGNTTIFNATMPPSWCGKEVSPSPVAEFTLSETALASSIVILIAIGTSGIVKS